MDDRGIIPTSGGIAHPTTGGIVAMMGGINPMPGSITPMTCCIIPITGNIVLLFMAAVIVPKMGSRVLTAGGRFPMMGERIGTGNPAGGTVNAVTWDWIDGAPLHHLRRESTPYAGVLLETDGSMKWRRQRSGHSSLTSSLFILHNVEHSSQCQVCHGDHIPSFRIKLYTKTA
jgi:hypothetical protein